MSAILNQIWEEAQRLDSENPLKSVRQKFVSEEGNLIYLDGNSLGWLPIETISHTLQVPQQQWGKRLIRS